MQSKMAAEVGGGARKMARKWEWQYGLIHQYSTFKFFIDLFHIEWMHETPFIIQKYN